MIEAQSQQAATDGGQELGEREKKMQYALSVVTFRLNKALDQDRQSTANMGRVDEKIRSLKEELNQNPELREQLDVTIDDENVPFSEIEKLRV